MVGAILELQANGKPLDRSCIIDLVQTTIDTLPEHEPDEKSFSDNKSGKKCLSNFLQRYPDIDVRTPTSIEFKRVATMCSNSTAAHFARIKNYAMNTVSKIHLMYLI